MITESQIWVVSTSARALNRLLGFALLMLMIISISNCARKAPLVEIRPQPAEKFILMRVTEVSRLGKPLWIKGNKYYPLTDMAGFVQYGRASWYGPKFHGKKTSSGEIYNMHGMTAAHKTLPLGTLVKVVNLNNHRSTIVRINDRGPFVKGRIIDLSYGAAKRIGLLGPGVARVKLVVLGREVGLWHSPGGLTPILRVPNIQQGAFTVQIGAYSDRTNALNIADRLKTLFRYVEVVPVKTVSGKGGTLFRVRVSRSKTLDQANSVKDRLRRIGFEEAFVVSL